jgi:hypothetical protein
MDLVVEGDRVAMVYDCELAPPVGVIKISSFFRVVAGKVSTYGTYFDATELRKLSAHEQCSPDRSMP